MQFRHHASRAVAWHGLQHAAAALLEQLLWTSCFAMAVVVGTFVLSRHLQGLMGWRLLAQYDCSRSCDHEQHARHPVMLQQAPQGWRKHYAATSTQLTQAMPTPAAEPATPTSGRTHIHNRKPTRIPLASHNAGRRVTRTEEDTKAN